MIHKILRVICTIWLASIAIAFVGAIGYIIYDYFYDPFGQFCLGAFGSVAMTIFSLRYLESRTG